VKILENEITGTQTSFSISFGDKLSFILRASAIDTYIFPAPTYTTTIITLKPCALNAELQQFIL
jgi:hypothetical protein